MDPFKKAALRASRDPALVLLGGTIVASYFAAMYVSKHTAAILASAPLLATAAEVDSSWHPPASSQVNDLNSALTSDGVYGFIFDSSETPDGDYGTYNWCNMPHVRATEYVRPPPEYELQYVELVSPPLPQDCASRLNSPRSTAITSAHRTQITPSPWSPTAGTATTKACTVTASTSGATRPRVPTGRATPRT